MWVRDARASLPLGLGVRICPASRGRFWAYFYAQVRGFFAFLVVFVGPAVVILGDFCAQVRGFFAPPKVFETQCCAQVCGF